MSVAKVDQGRRRPSVVGHGDLTNSQCARLEPLLPRGKKQGGPPMWTRWQLIDGIRWRTRAGALWRDVPERYGLWDRVSFSVRVSGRRLIQPTTVRTNGAAAAGARASGQFRRLRAQSRRLL
ncbi:transposase [Streptomyces sp. NPDC001795]|uniref:transposase n=1 Tax=Streptomyces sp. NPDC001795 TaxID=3154525 RepID=UPI003323D160